MKLGIITAAVFMFFSANSLQAQEAPKPCKADVEKFCKGVKPGEGRIVACLKAHEAELTAECKAKGLEAKAKAADKAEACKADLEKFCKGVKGKKGEKGRCLKEHQKELSAGCAADLVQRKEEALRKNPCLAEMEKFCKGMQKGEGRIKNCMKEHEAELSQGCKAHNEKMKEKRGEGKKGSKGGKGKGKGGKRPAPPAEEEGD